MIKFHGKWIYGNCYPIMRRKNFIKNKGLRWPNFWQMFWWDKLKIKIWIDPQIFHFNSPSNSIHQLNLHLRVINLKFKSQQKIQDNHLIQWDPHLIVNSFCRRWRIKQQTNNTISRPYQEWKRKLISKIVQHTILDSYRFPPNTIIKWETHCQYRRLWKY